MSSDNCVVISIGSHNEWDFEEAVIAQFPGCRIHTLDCYVDKPIIPASIQKSTTFHKICLDVYDHTYSGRQFVSWHTFVRQIGLKQPPTVMKMDIEGFEWATIPAIIKTNVMVPESFSFELHYYTSIGSVYWFRRFRTDPEIGLFSELMLSFGYVLVDRNDNRFCSSCSELVMAKILPNTRFFHHSSSILSMGNSTDANHTNLLANAEVFPTPPK